MADPHRRLSGILLPLFSIRSRTDFGVGDFGALDALFPWLEAAGQKLVMLLPLLPTSPGDSSPYGTRSAFGLNGLFIDLHQLPEFAEAGAESSLSQDEQLKLEEARRSPRVRYDLVFELRGAILRRAFDLFDNAEWAAKSVRGRAFEEWRSAQAEWLADFTLYTAISEAHGLRPWWEWPEGLRDRHPAALEVESARLAREVRYQAWVQWVAEQQWSRVREKARHHGVLICGDEPFIIGQDSADVWAHPKLLRLDARLGVPPDDFSADGQDWGLPYFDFPAIAADDYAWLKFRAKKAASYYDLRRVDHAVGYFRQWIRDAQTPKGRFIPATEPEQAALGATVFRLLSADAGIVAEDLGVIPPFVRHALTELNLPGYRVMRWEAQDGVYRNPHEYPVTSLATTGTHDTETLAEWWEAQGEGTHQAMARAYPELAGVQLERSFSPAIHQALIRAALHSSSELCVLPWQDVLASRERVNLPGSQSDANWSYRMAPCAEELLARDDTRSAAEWLKRLTLEAGR